MRNILSALLLSLLVAGCHLDDVVPELNSAGDSTSTAVAPTSRANSVKLLRVPDGGIQPQVVVDERGTVHLIYFKGDPAAGDLFYTRQAAGKEAFSRPVKVNRQPGSVVAAGTIRGGQIAVGRGGRVHVLWNGSSKSIPEGGSTPLLYAQLSDKGTTFEPERNVITWAAGLDGGSSVAADQKGNVYVVWHAGPHGSPEDERAVYVARSSDSGSTFDRETRVSPEETGVCGCCGLRAFVDSKGLLYVLYRGAADGVHRDMHLLTSNNHGKSYEHARVDPWELPACPMSSAAFAETADGVVGAWQTEEQVYFAAVAAGMVTSKPMAPPGKAGGRKHPVLAAHPDGPFLMAWTEGTGWAKGGALAWQLYDAKGRPTSINGRTDGVPVWSMPAAYVDSGGDFMLMF